MKVHRPDLIETVPPPPGYEGPEQARDTGGLLACPIDGEPASALFGNCGHSWSAALSQGAAHEERGLDVERLAERLANYGTDEPEAWSFAVHNIPSFARVLARVLATPEAAPDE